jgi:hypothetical protein
VERPDDARQEIIAYRVGNPMPLVTALTARDWMSQTDARFAYRCLPLLLANQAGWFILNTHRLQATWSGGADQASLRIDYLSGEPPYPAMSHFGSGILTWHIPYLFRTPPDVNLLARGPANWPKDGIYPLEGLVETDWTEATFTMNWKLTRPDLTVTFEVDEPICMIVPQGRGTLERYAPLIRDLASDLDLEAGYYQWSASRSRFLSNLPTPGTEANRQLWQKNYFRGKSLDGQPAPQHQTKLHLREFEDETK